MIRRSKLRSAACALQQAQLEWLDERDRPSVDEQLAVVRKLQRRRANVRRNAVVLMVAACTVAAVGYRFREPSNVTFSVQGHDGKIGDPIDSNDVEQGVAFSEGSQLTVAPHGRARVVAVNAKGANVVLERGTVHANVIHRDRTSWSLSAGPFAIRVTGTAFDATWDPATERLRVVMREGRVVVEGPCIAPSPLVAGEHHEWHCGGELVKVPEVRERVPVPANSELLAPSISTGTFTGTPTSTPRPSASPTLEHNAPDGRILVGSEPSPSTPSSAGGVAPVSWRDRAREGNYAEAWALAEQGGVDSLGADDLLFVADVARLAKKPAHASRLYRSVRDRFPDGAQAKTAGFQLGRLAGSSNEARTWFERYLVEQPTGQFSQEALGRLVELDASLGDRSRAVERARVYLERYPSGPHAAFARSVLGS